MASEEVARPALADLRHLLHTPVGGHPELLAGHSRHVCRHQLTAHSATYHPHPSIPSPTLALGSQYLVAMEEASKRPYWLQLAKLL